MPAEQFLRQEIIHGPLASCGGVFVCGHFLADRLEGLFVYDCRDSALNPDFSVDIHPGIAFIQEHGPEGVFVELRPFGGAVAFIIEGFANLLDRMPLGVEAERLPDDFRGGFIYDILLSFNLVP